MGDAGVKRLGNHMYLSEERVDLLPDRTTLAAVGASRYGFAPTNAVVTSPTSSNFPIDSPASNNAMIDNVAQPQVTGGFMPVVITLIPTINVIVQQSGTDGLDAGHHAGPGVADGIPGHDAPADGSNADGASWLDLLRRLFGI
jgi:hypothetical protein